MQSTHLCADNVSIADYEENLLPAGGNQDGNRNQDNRHDASPGCAKLVNPNALQISFASLLYRSWLAPMSIQPGSRIKNGVSLAATAESNAISTSRIRNPRILE